MVYVTLEKGLYILELNLSLQNLSNHDFNLNIIGNNKGYIVKTLL